MQDYLNIFIDKEYPEFIDKYLNTETKTEYMWSETNPGEDWVATGKSREKYIQTGYKEETRTVQRNRQK